MQGQQRKDHTQSQDQRDHEGGVGLSDWSGLGATASSTVCQTWGALSKATLLAQLNTNTMAFTILTVMPTALIACLQTAAQRRATLAEAAKQFHSITSGMLADANAATPTANCTHHGAF